MNLPNSQKTVQEKAQDILSEMDAKGLSAFEKVNTLIRALAEQALVSTALIETNYTLSDRNNMDEWILSMAVRLARCK